MLLLIPALHANEDWETTVARIRQEAAITYTGQYEVKCPLEVVEKALDHPAFMGTLWEIYGYAPAYKVQPLETPGAIHVDDPTGIVGDLWPLKRQGPSRVYLARGKIDHWAVPALNGGLAVFEVETVARDTLTEVTVDVFIEPQSRFASMILGVLEPLLIKHIDNRVSLNFQDAAQIMEEINQQPEAVTARLKKEALRQEFARIF